MPWVQDFLAKYPELAVYLAVAIGYSIGKLKIAGIGLGPVTGSLLAGMLIGQFAHVPVSSMAKSFLFLLFLFGIGYSVGPQFMESLKRDGIKPVLVAVVVCLTGLAVATSVAKFIGLDPGFAAGLLSGALTESPAMGTATEAINALPLPAADRTILVSHVAVADAVCYLFGAFFVILFCSQIGPKLLRIDLREEALQLERAYGIERGKAGLFSAWRRFELRAYRVQHGSAIVGSSLAAAESRAADHRLFVQRIRRGDDIIEAEPNLVLQPDDIVAIAGPRKVLIDLLGEAQQEVEDRELLDIPVTIVQVLLTNRELAGQRLDELAQSGWTRSVYLRDLTRGGQSVPIAAGIELRRGDILHLVGPEAVVNRAALRIGSVVAPTAETDFVTLGLAIFLGGLVGVLLAVPIGGVRVSLSTSVGTLLAGLAVGHLRTRYPLFGRIPDGAINLMTALGLAAFVAMIGLNAGPIFLTSVAQAGIGLLLGGMLVTAAPMFVGLYFGHYVLKMNPILLLGALAGAQTMTAGMAAVQDRSGSPVAVLGYTPAVPFGHILLTIWGTIIVALVAS